MTKRKDLRNSSSLVISRYPQETGGMVSLEGTGFSNFCRRYCAVDVVDASAVVISVFCPTEQERDSSMSAIDSVAEVIC